MENSPKKQVVFNFNDSDKEVEKDDIERSSKNNSPNSKRKFSNNDKEKHDDKDNKSDGKNSINHIKNIDVYDRLNFNRLQVKRNSRKGQTSKCPKINFTIEKFTDEITKITEDLSLANFKSENLANFNNRRSDNKKRTIRFAEKKVTYQYPKEKEIISNFEKEKIKSMFSDKEDKEEDTETANKDENIEDDEVEPSSTNFNFVDENEYDNDSNQDK